VLAHATRLRWIQSPAAGLGMLLSDRLRSSDILLTNSRGINAQPVAEQALALSLALARRLHTAITRQASSTWAQNELTEPAPRVLRGLTLGVVGLGAIGTEVARLAGALGMRVIAMRRRVDLPAPAWVDEVVAPHALRRLLGESDVVVLAAPETHETARLIGAPELESMKPGALLVNVGRGALVDEAALVDALRSGRIGGAGLDVFDEEPLPAASPLWSLPNVIVTPHVAGIRGDYWTVAVDMFVENLRRFEAGEPLLNLVDKEAGY
jgi:phosphoglycerate dehydrogenase-like enzyme